MQYKKINIQMKMLKKSFVGFITRVRDVRRVSNVYQQSFASLSSTATTTSSTSSSKTTSTSLFLSETQQQQVEKKHETIEKFEYPAYWNQDFPSDFDDEMKHEVEKLMIFQDYTFFMDETWQKEIHPLFDGSSIKMIVNIPLEDFNEKLFIDDNSTYDTKVIMEIPLDCFHGLNQKGLEIIKQLAGPRYQANKKQLKLTEDKFPKRILNHKRLCDILHDLTEQAHQLSTTKK